MIVIKGNLILKDERDKLSMENHLRQAQYGKLMK